MTRNRISIKILFEPNIMYNLFVSADKYSKTIFLGRLEF